MTAVALRGLDEAIGWFGRKSQGQVFDAALSRALNKLADWANTQLRRSISSDLGVQQKLIKPRFVITKSSAGRVVAQVWFGAYRIPLYKAAGGRATKRAHGVSTPVRGGQSGYVPGGFVAKMPKSGNTGIYQRVGKPRLPIREVMLPVAESGERAFASLMSGPLQDRFEALLEHEMQRALS